MISRRIFGQMLASIGLAAPALAKPSPADAMLEARIAERETMTAALNESTAAIRGAMSWAGAGAPGDILGQAGDLYIDMPSGDLYYKASDWEFVQNMISPPPIGFAKHAAEAGANLSVRSSK